MKREDIEHLGRLARISLTEKELDDFSTSITNILGYVSAVDEISAGEMVKKTGVVKNVMRDDGSAHEPGIHTEALLAAAPRRKGQYIEVKKILDNG